MFDAGGMSAAWPESDDGSSGPWAGSQSSAGPWGSDRSRSPVRQRRQRQGRGRRGRGRGKVRQSSRGSSSKGGSVSLTFGAGSQEAQQRETALTAAAETHKSAKADQYQKQGCDPQLAALALARASVLPLTNCTVGTLPCTTGWEGLPLRRATKELPWADLRQSAGSSEILLLDIGK